MTVNQFIKKLQGLKKGLREVDIAVMPEKGLLVEPELKFLLKDRLSKENVEKVIISWRGL